MRKAVIIALLSVVFVGTVAAKCGEPVRSYDAGQVKMQVVVNADHYWESQISCDGGASWKTSATRGTQEAAIEHANDVWNNVIKIDPLLVCP